MRNRKIPKLVTIVVICAAAGVLLALSLRRAPQLSNREQFKQALAAFDRGELDRVSKIQRNLDNQPGFENEALLLRGAVLLRSEKLSEALAALSRVAPSSELQSLTLLLKGECQYKLGRLAESERTFRELKSHNPDDVDAHRWLGAIYYDLGANDLAIQELRTVMRLAPNDWRPHRLVGLMHLDFEKYQEAIEDYGKSLALSPPKEVRPEIVRELARAHLAKNEFNVALKLLADLPETAYSLSLLSECYWSLGEVDRAKELLARAAKLNADERAVLFLKARILVGEGRHEEAIAPLKRVLRKNPQDAECRYQLALVYRKLKRISDHDREISRWQEARKLMEQLTELNLQAIQRPTDAAIRLELAEVCHKLGKEKLSKMWTQAAQTARDLGNQKRQPTYLPAKS